MNKVSVIIPAYNVAEYIEKCIQSLLNQTLTEIEIIVVNDGSKDNTLAILQSISDSRLKIIDQVNSGVSQARNAGLGIATGEYIFQLDGDDWIEETALFDMYQVAKEKDLDIVISDAFVDDGISAVYFNSADHLKGDGVQDLLLANITANVWSKLYKRILFTANNISYHSKISIGEDLLLNIALFHKAKKVYHLKKAYVHYMQREVSLTKVYSERLLQVFTMCELIKEYLVKNNLFEKYHKEFESMEYQHTYYYRVIVDTNSRKIHRQFYDKGMEKYQDYLKNSYIVDFLNFRTKGEQKIEKIFRFNYQLGCLRLRLIKYFHMFDKK